MSYADGAQVACGFGTAYEGLRKIGISGDDSVLVVGLGPVGLAAARLAKALGAHQVVGTDLSPSRVKLAETLAVCDHAILSSDAALDALLSTTSGGRGFSRAVDCSGSAAGRRLGLQATSSWGRMVLLGEGSEMSFEPSPDLMHGQKTVFGSWVTSTWLMQELVERLRDWNLHPSELITHRFGLAETSKAYAVMASADCGKVAVCFDEELS